MRNEPQSWLMLKDWLAQRTPAQQAYALIDLAGLRGDGKQALRFIKDRGGVNILDDARPEAETACAWLVSLSADGEGLKDAAKTLHWATASAAVTWLRSELDLRDLAHALHARTKAELPDAHAILLRCYDPRVLPELMRVLADDPQAGAYWGMSGSWAYLDRTQTLQSLPLSNTGANNPFEAPLRLSQRHTDALLAAAEVDQVMPELVRESPEYFLGLPPEQRVAFTRGALRMADQHGLASLADRVLMGVLLLEVGSESLARKPWSEALAQVKSGNWTLAQAIEEATQP